MSKKCPYCAEEIADEAIKCKHCGEFLNETENKKEVEINHEDKTEMNNESKNKKKNDLLPIIIILGIIAFLLFIFVM